MPARRTIFFAVALTAWAGCLVAGFAALTRYSAQAGAARAIAPRGAAFLAQHQHAGRGLLVIAVHPLCPCTDASLAELGDLLARSRGSCDALIVQYEPERPKPDWPALVTQQRLGGQRVPVVPDRGGELAGALGAQTSGHVVFVDARGAIRFQGGLTLARGHRGRSPAQDAILALLDGQPAAISRAPVFGCALEAECRADPSS